jgi:hypothetical protein
MKNGLCSIHIHMLDGVKGRDSGVPVLRDGVLFGRRSYFMRPRRPPADRIMDDRVCAGIITKIIMERSFSIRTATTSRLFATRTSRN